MRIVAATSIVHQGSDDDFYAATISKKNLNKSSLPSTMREVRGAVVTVAVGLAGAVLVQSMLSYKNYTDYSTTSIVTSDGRTRNSIATIVSGIVAQKITSGPASFDMTAEKFFYPDATITGYVTPQTIDSRMHLSLAQNRFRANTSKDSLFGDVRKSEYDWNVERSRPDEYTIGRLGLKFDTKLSLSVKEGKINGVYDRPFGFDWDIKGYYDQKGNVIVKIDVPWSNCDMRLKGRVVKR